VEAQLFGVKPFDLLTMLMAAAGDHMLLNL